MDAAVTFDPLSELIQEEDCNTLRLHLPGFTKEQLRVQLTRSKLLKISGLRPIGDDKWSRFQKDFPIPENVDSNKITARFEDGVLHVKQPKLISPPEKHEQESAAAPPEHQSPAPPNAAGSNQAGPEKKTGEAEAAKTGGGDSDQKKAESDRKKIPGSINVDMLKMGKEKMMRVLLLLFVFVLGMFVSRLRWFSPGFQKSEMEQ